MKLAFIGIGRVGFALADGLQRKGHEIIVAHDDPQSESVEKARAKNPAFGWRPVQEAIDAAEMILLSVPFNANREVLAPLDFRGKVLVDCTNPVGPGISHGLNSQVSGAERVQEWAANARVVKAYSVYGFENLQNPTFPAYGVKPVMPLAGNDLPAKQQVARLNHDLGFETLDVGDLSQALHLEHLTLLWVKMVRRDGHHPNFTWAYLER